MATIARSTTFRRRPFLLEPGDTLLLEPDPIRVMVNFGRFVEETGVPADVLRSSRLTALPLPTGKIRDCPGVRPEMAWLPLLWLPPHLARQKTYAVGEDGLAHTVSSAGAGGREVYEESEEEWAVRVALELSAAGFYDATTGTFLDVMDLVGIDIDVPAGLGRVREWLAGGPDDDLDLLATGLELEGHLRSTSEPDWALNEAIVNREHLVHCAYAAGTEALVDTLDELSGALAAGRAELEEAKTLFETVCIGAASWLDDLPLEDASAGRDEVVPEDVYWLELAEDAGRFVGAPERFVEEHLRSARARLVEICDATRPLADAYLAEAASEPSAGEHTPGNAGSGPATGDLGTESA